MDCVCADRSYLFGMATIVLPASLQVSLTSHHYYVILALPDIITMVRLALSLTALPLILLIFITDDVCAPGTLLKK